MAILRLPAVKLETGYRCHKSIYDAVRAGLFPKQIPIGERSVGWPDNEVRAVVAARVAGRTDDEIRALVTRLHAKRAELAQALEAA